MWYYSQLIGVEQAYVKVLSQENTPEWESQLENHSNYSEVSYIHLL